MTFHHVPAEKNTIVDCFSRLTREIKEAQHYSLCDTVKLSDTAARLQSEGKTGFSVKAIKHGTTTRPIEDDPWVEYLGEVAMSDIGLFNLAEENNEECGCATGSL